MTIQRRRIHWSGFIGGPGLTTLYSQEGAALNTPIRAFFNSIVGYLPAGMTITIDNAGDEIDETNGHLTGSWADTTVTPVTGGTSGAYAAPAGLMVEWSTDQVSAHRRVRGKTYLVPSNQITTAGQPVATAVAGILTAANTLVAAAAAPNALKVWHRPGKGLSDGFAATVTGASVPNKVVILRSRRD